MGNIHAGVGGAAGPLRSRPSSSGSNLPSSLSRQARQGRPRPRLHGAAMADRCRQAGPAHSLRSGSADRFQGRCFGEEVFHCPPYALVDRLALSNDMPRAHPAALQSRVMPGRMRSSLSAPLSPPVGEPPAGGPMALRCRRANRGQRVSGCPDMPATRRSSSSTTSASGASHFARAGAGEHADRQPGAAALAISRSWRLSPTMAICEGFRPVRSQKAMIDVRRRLRVGDRVVAVSGVEHLRDAERQQRLFRAAGRNRWWPRPAGSRRRCRLRDRLPAARQRHRSRGALSRP